MGNGRASADRRAWNRAEASVMHLAPSLSAPSILSKGGARTRPPPLPQILASSKLCEHCRNAEREQGSAAQPID
jgi:hypothetical protein